MLASFTFEDVFAVTKSITTNTAFDANSFMGPSKLNLEFVIHVNLSYQYNAITDYFHMLELIFSFIVLEYITKEFNHYFYDLTPTNYFKSCSV